MPGRRTTADERLSRLYHQSHRAWRGALRTADSAFLALWLGLLDHASLARVDESFFLQRRESTGDGTAGYVDEAWNTSGLHDWEAAAVERHFPAAGRVLVTGAGGGREVLALLERGFDAHGWEPNAVLVAAGAALLAARGYPDRLHPSAREGFPPGTGRADGVISGWGSYMLMVGSARRIAWLRGARAVLDADAPVLLSFFPRPAGDRRGVRMARLANGIRRLRRAEPVEVGDTLNPNYIHRFTRDEIERELAAGGFRLVHHASEPYGHVIGRAV